MRMRALLGSTMMMLSIATSCGGGQTEVENTPTSVLPCDQVELMARTTRPDNLQREVEYIENDWVGAHGVPTEHVQARLQTGVDPSALATRVGASVRSVEGWHQFVFPNVQAAKDGLPVILCDANVMEATLSLEHPTIH